MNRIILWLGFRIIFNFGGVDIGVRMYYEIVLFSIECL